MGAPPSWSHRWDHPGHTLTHIPSPTPEANQCLGGVLGRRWEVPGQPLLSPLKFRLCSGHRGELWAGSPMPPSSNTVLLCVALSLCLLVCFSVKWTESLLEDQRRLWEDGSAVNTDVIIIILITILLIINGVTTDQEWKGERGVCKGVTCCVSSPAVRYTVDAQ